MSLWEEVVAKVDALCRAERIPMLGPARSSFVAEWVEKIKPHLVVECGTAVGYSGLWIGRALKRNGFGKLITLEINPRLVELARNHFREAGLEEVIEVRLGDARELVKEIEGPVDFVLIDNGFANYYPCWKGIEPKLAEKALIIADNVGLGAERMEEFLREVRSRFRTETHWFDLDLEWSPRDAMEVIFYERGKSPTDG